MKKGSLVNYRHGDIALIGVDEIPKELKAAKTNVIHRGKTQAHKFDNGKFFPAEHEVFIGYLEAKNTTLLHPEHGTGDGKEKKAKIKDGSYKIIMQQEMTHTGMRGVED